MASNSENAESRDGKLSYLSRISDENSAKTYARSLLGQFCKDNVSRFDAQEFIKDITREILYTFFPHRSDTDNKNLILATILRAGIPMWVAANEFFKTHESSFISCKREKGTNEVLVHWDSRPSLAGKEIIILDTILATGRTINATCGMIASLSQDVSSIHVLSCYASPEAINSLLCNSVLTNLFVGIISSSVDNHGFLIPSTSGDAGDKCFGQIVQI